MPRIKGIVEKVDGDIITINTKSLARVTINPITKEEKHGSSWDNEGMMPNVGAIVRINFHRKDLKK